MSATLNHDLDIETLSTALVNAAGELAEMSNENQQAKDELENHGWSGLDKANTAAERISAAYDSLVDVADKIGVGGRLVRDAFLANDKVGNKESVTDRRQ